MNLRDFFITITVSIMLILGAAFVKNRHKRVQQEIKHYDTKEAFMRDFDEEFRMQVYRAKAELGLPLHRKERVVEIQVLVRETIVIPDEPVLNFSRNGVTTREGKKLVTIGDVLEAMNNAMMA